MSRPKSNNVGVIGLGIIGSRIAAALRKRGRQVFVWNRTPRPEQNFVGSAAEVAELCDCIQIFVSDDDALLEVANQLVPALTAHHIIVAHCTVAPENMRAAAQIVERRGARFLEAPFTGSKIAAENGQLVYYIGGDEMALKQARPILELSSREIVPIGEIGTASVIKVATNIVTAATAQVAAEALAIVRRAGISGEIFSQAMKSNASNSTTIEMKVPMMLAGDFEPHFSVKHMLKDVRIAARLARQFDLEVPMTEVASDMLLAEMKQGRGDADYASVAQRYFPVSVGSVASTAVKSIDEPLAPPAFTIEETVVLVAEPATRPVEGEGVKSDDNKNDGPESEQPALAEAITSEAISEEPKPAEATKPKEEKSEEEKKEEPEMTEPANLSGGIRGWFSRFAR